MQVDSLPAEPPGKPKSWSLLGEAGAQTANYSSRAKSEAERSKSQCRVGAEMGELNSSLEIRRCFMKEVMGSISKI